MFCKHDWKIVVDDLTPSPIERLGGMQANITNAGYETLLATRIIILKCEHCGKLDKTIEKV